ncbi:Rha family transcriptional regulator [Pseudomonas sp. N40(2020)]|uniref:Rha family transcriptional regulator n=1 Tax=Pseudomonas sp. N40(2020) TaxID=2767798 RepID=UPI001656DB94|nr:Rha family transcriptional regulator [Pseudomonas sp. N40(2020)]MBC8994953.1 Rha family transcriptional regulator [Pseudomonas sp. N40(2020)]
MTIVIIKDGDAVTTTLAIAKGTLSDHASVIKLVRTYQSDLEEFGLLDFKSESTGGRPTEYAFLNEPQSTLLLTYMRNTDIVRAFKKKLVREFWEMVQQRNQPMTQAEITAANANHLVAVERQQREQQVALERIERRVEDLSQTTVWDHCPQNCQSLTRIKETMLARHGLSGAVVDYVLKVWPNQPNPAGMVRNGHEEALGSQYLVWSKSHVTAAFHRFVSESTMATATQATHPYFEGRFRLVQKAPQ